MADTPLLVDPAVSRGKFDREVASYRQLEDVYRRKGWWVQEASFPTVFAVFAAQQLKPPAVLFGARLDFTNYDLWPPSVRLVDPFTREPYPFGQVPVMLPQRVNVPGPPVPGLEAPSVQAQALVQGSPDEAPFVCLPGVREYHHHPGHTGDSWLLHRKRGEGTLNFILDKLHLYGVTTVAGFALNVPIRVGTIQMAMLHQVNAINLAIKDPQDLPE